MVRGLVVVLAVALVGVAAAFASPLPARPALAVSCGQIADSGVVWAPSGRVVAFTRVRGSGAISQVFRIRVDGTGVRLLSRPGEYAYGVAWSPDGSRIAYTTFDLAAVVRIVVARSDGTKPRVLAAFQGRREPPTTFLSWSPDGKELAYVDWSGELNAVQVEGGGARTWLDDLILARNGKTDTIVCGPSHDLVTADRRDRIAADCESVKRR